MELKVYVIYLDGFALCGCLTPFDTIVRIRLHAENNFNELARYSYEAIDVARPALTSQDFDALSDLEKLDKPVVVMDKRREAVKLARLPE